MRFEIWLGTHYSHFDHGVAHLDDGSTVALAEWIHTSTYGRDTLLLDREDRLLDIDYPLRWYIEKNGLSFSIIGIRKSLRLSCTTVPGGN